MSLEYVRRALEQRLDALIPALATAHENEVYTPTPGTPYQRINLLPNIPDNSIMGARTYFERGIFQVTLCYPVGVGPATIDARAQALRAHFKRGNSMLESGVMVLVTDTPRISGGFSDKDRWCVPVSVSFQAQITT